MMGSLASLTNNLATGNQPCDPLLLKDKISAVSWDSSDSNVAIVHRTFLGTPSLFMSSRQHKHAVLAGRVQRSFAVCFGKKKNRQQYSLTYESFDRSVSYMTFGRIQQWQMHPNQWFNIGPCIDSPCKLSGQFNSD